MATVTIGANTYEVYSDVDTADDYFLASTNFTAWDAYTDDEKSRGLVSATRLIDRQVWTGTLTTISPSTGLKWPRTSVTDCDGDAVDEDAIPDGIIEASQLLAFYLLEGTITTTSNTTQDRTKRLKADTVEIEYFRLDPDVAGGRFPTDILELIGCFLSSSTQIAGSISYGTDGTPADTDFGLTDSF
jgi:hypothetical protein